MIGYAFLSHTGTGPAASSCTETPVNGYIWHPLCPGCGTSAEGCAEAPRSPPPAAYKRSGRFNAMLVNDLILTDDAPGDAASRPVVLDRSRTVDAERMNHLI